VGHLEYLKRLIEAEVARREDKSLAHRIRRARFPLTKTLDQFQWNWPKKNQPAADPKSLPSELRRAEVQCHFLRRCRLGKTHLCIALGHAACVRGYSVLFTTPSTSSTPCRPRPATGSLKRTMQRYLKPKLLVVG